MKKALALCAFALAMALPLVSSASSITNTFVTSSTGSEQLGGAGDTIQFEVTVTTNAGQLYTAVLWTLSGDIVAATGESSPFPTTQNAVTNWVWHYTKGNPSVTGGSLVKMGTDGRFTPDVPGTPTGPGVAVSALYGFLANKTGDGIPAMVGTVTITASADGTYQGGGYLQPGVGFFGNATVTDSVDLVGGAFTVGVVPEPGTALLLMLGLGGLGLMGRSHRK